ncbi:MAG: beta-propeller domain-containing protein [Candidatus Aquicultorales bacterium]
MHANWSRLGFRNLEEKAELEEAARLLKSAFPVDSELDEATDRRILAAVEEKRAQRPRPAPDWPRALKVAVGACAGVAVLGSLLVTFGARLPVFEKPALQVAGVRENPAIETDLPVVGSYEKLRTLAAERLSTLGYRTQGIDMPLMRADNRGAYEAMTDGELSAVFGATAASESGKYSGTNVQVQGVDEADIVKTDGKNIYQVTRDRVIVSRANPVEEMRVLSVVNFDSSVQPLELYVDGKDLVVIGIPYNGGFVSPQARGYYGGPQSVKAIAYDISDASNPKKAREVEIDGAYLSSRKIGSVLYLVANKYLDFYSAQAETTETAATLLKPGYRDSAIGGGYRRIDYSGIRYFPGSAESNYLMVASLDIDKPREEMKIASYLGAGQNVYSSTENLYVASTLNSENPNNRSVDTTIYRFALEGGRLLYQAKGRVPGVLLNQFSMDEFKDSFRVATTSGFFGRGPAASGNNVYVLNKDMSIVGKLEDLAPGERIYSTRFMGERAYVVTFKQVDPLFVIDLSKPSSPRVLGELKIPGFSDYLHPYDENHIIGFGKDTVEAGWQGFGLQQGMKIALFDVSDVKNPVEKFKVVIGDRGTESELLQNHKALLFDKELGLMAFPVTLREFPGNEAPNSWDWGNFTFQGAYVYKISLEKGMELKGRITHISKDDERTTAIDMNPKRIERILYIGDTLYTVSQGMIKANRLGDLKELKSLSVQ